MTLPRNEEKSQCKSDYNNFILCAICVMFLANSNWWIIIEIRRLLLASITCDFTGELGRWVGPMIYSKNKGSESHYIFPSVSSVTMNIPLNKAQTPPRPIPSPLLKTLQLHLIALCFFGFFFFFFRKRISQHGPLASCGLDCPYWSNLVS